MRVFLDTSVFIWAYSRPDGNSAKILELVDDGRLEAVTSEKALEELKRYFSLYHDSRSAYAVLQHVKACVRIIPRTEVREELGKWSSKIKEKDLEHVATVKALGLQFLVAVDRDFKPFPEYATPKQFLKKLGLKAKESEY